MYAIAFDFDMQLLEQLYPNPSWRNAYNDVRRFFEENGFENKQGSVYLSLEDVGPVECIAVVQDLTELYEVHAFAEGHPHAADRGEQRFDAGPRPEESPQTDLVLDSYDHHRNIWNQ